MSRERFPELALPGADGAQHRLGECLGRHGGVVVFYRGHW